MVTRDPVGELISLGEAPGVGLPSRIRLGLAPLPMKRGAETPPCISQ